MLGISSLQPEDHVSSISLSTVLIQASPNQTFLLQVHNALCCADEDQQPSCWASIVWNRGLGIGLSANSTLQKNA